jgi:hypothetical protein
LPLVYARISLRDQTMVTFIANRSKHGIHDEVLLPFSNRPYLLFLNPIHMDEPVEHVFDIPYTFAFKPPVSLAVYTPGIGQLLEYACQLRSSLYIASSPEYPRSYKLRHLPMKRILDKIPLREIDGPVEVYSRLIHEAFDHQTTVYLREVQV